MTDAFDADVLIYAANPDHPLGPRVSSLLTTEATRIGSLVLLPELLSKPRRDSNLDQVRALTVVLSRLTLHAFDLRTARIAVDLASRYRLRPADAAHLATAVVESADRFITNNRRDFPKSIGEIDIVYPDELPATTPPGG